jgi:phosphatidylglycerophosphatase A
VASITSPDRRFLIGHPAHFFALGLGAGLAPKAPGTVGTLAAFPLFLVLDTLPPFWQWTALALAFLTGIRICQTAGEALGVADHGAIVWDEIVAFCLLLAAVPAGFGWWMAAFVLFRFFDILKPWPIRQVEAHFCDAPPPAWGRAWWSGLGVMLDDLLAAACALVIIEILRWLT